MTLNFTALSSSSTDTARPIPAPDGGPWSDPVIGTLYRSFAGQEWYRLNNRRLLQLVPPSPDGAWVDLGSGTGSGTELLTEHAGPQRPVIGIDSSRALVELSAASVTSKSGARVAFLHGSAENFGSIVPGPIGSIFAFNAIHLFEDPVAVIRQAASRLEPGGSLAFNTGFSADSITKENRESWIRLVRALRVEFERRGFSREKVEHRSKTFGWERFAILLRESGFCRIQAQFHDVAIPRASIGEFLRIPGLAGESLPSAIPQRERAEIVESALGRLNIQSFSRRWVMVSAQR